MNFYQFHDSILQDVIFNWKEGVILINTLSYEGVKTIKLRNVNSIYIPKFNPWGRSNSINEVSYKDYKFKIEMQSGDIIEIYGELKEED